MQKFLQALAGSQKYFVNYVSVAIFIVMAWIGGLKVVQYEADGIVPFVTNSPFFSYMYSKKDIVDNGKGKMVAEYNLHKNPEGLVVPKNIEWHKQNGTYAVSYLIGAMICTIGTLVLLGIWFPKLGLIGGLLTFGMSIVTLSFLITTPETWVPNLGNPAGHHGGQHVQPQQHGRHHADQPVGAAHVFGGKAVEDAENVGPVQQ
ncbi:MAG: DUF417 family protein, partial [Campylobacter sp.]